MSEGANRTTIEFKKTMAKRFIDLGYSIKWFSDYEPRMNVYLPSKNQVELRATIVFDRDSNRGLRNTKISNLLIELQIEDLDTIVRTGWRDYPDIHILYERYGRREQTNRLFKWPTNLELYKNMQVLAQEMYNDILREFR